MDTGNFYTWHLICGFIHPVLPEVENKCLHGQGFLTPCSAVLLLTACSLAWWSTRWTLSQCSWVPKCNLGRAEGESLNSLSYRQYVQPACTLKGDQRLSTGEQNGLLSGFRFCWPFFFKLKKKKPINFGCNWALIILGTKNKKVLLHGKTFLEAWSAVWVALSF